jgi:cytochrome c peroxidase
MNVAYQEVMLWNGQFGVTGPNEGTQAKWSPGGPRETNWLGFHGVETQAIAGLGVHRMGSLNRTLVGQNAEYVALWQLAFPDQPVDVVRAGLAIAAYERSLLANRAPFQEWLRGRSHSMSDLEKEGAILFFGEAECVACHTGPALNSMSFHALGMADLAGPDVAFDPRDLPEPLGRGEFSDRPEEAYTFKTPQLYNLAEAGFLGHGASFSDIRSVIVYKNQGVPETQIPADALSTHFRPLALDDRQIDALTAFVSTSLRDPDLARYVPGRLPSGQCFPVNDEVSRSDLGCPEPVSSRMGL